MKLLLAEDDPELSRQVHSWLTKREHVVSCCERGDDALRIALGERFDVLIVDVNLPQMDGFTMVERLRATNSRVPVIFLTARASVVDRVRGLGVGGDDYLTKPFSMAELVARLEALHRRAQQGVRPALAIGAWTLDTKARVLRGAKSQTIELQPRESALLEILIENAGHTLTKKLLLEKVWNIRFDPGTNVVDSMVCRLRRKIEKEIPEVSVQTVRGQGYVLKTTN